MLEVKNISKKYPGEALGAVSNISFNLEQGKIQSFVGRSGSGKTTMLRMLAGLMKPDEGEIFFNGEAYQDPDEQLIKGHSQVKLVFQDYQLKPNMTVAENIKYQLLLFDPDYQTERTNELLGLCGLKELAHKKPNELSGGQQQRLSLARALSEDPQMLLMDEPFSNLDPMTKRQLIFDLTEIVKVEGIGLILVTHDTQDALQLSDLIGFISEGRLLQNDTPIMLYEQPKSIEIAEFFGSINKINDEGDLAYLRANHLTLSEKNEGLEVSVLSSLYHGDGYLNHGTDQQNDFWFYSSVKLEKDSNVYLTCQKRHLLRF